MRNAIVLCITLSLLVSIASGLQINKQSENTAIPSQDDLSIERDWTATIVVVGYNQALIDEELLLQGMPSVRDYYANDVHITYNIDYQVAYADAPFTNELRQEMLDNSANGIGTGTSLDESALSYQKSHPDEPQRIFYPRSGRTIDGYAVEDWLEKNPYVTPPNLGYTLYLVNFSEFDSFDHSLEHWYDYHPIDPDTGEQQDWFRLEWDNALNQNITMDYPFFGGRYNTFLVDPSAHQWYLKWCRIWWSEDIVVEYDFWTQDLEDKVGSLNLEIPSGVEALNVYLRECIWDPINLLFFPYQHQPASYVSSGTLKALIFCMDVANGTSVESLEWVTDAEMQKAHLEELYPFIPWTVEVEYLDIEDEPTWNSLFWIYSEVEPDGTTAVYGSEMFNAIYYFMRPSYVATDENINVFGVVFIKKQMEMHTHGGIYTGLGGSGQTVVWKSWERYYRPDGVTPRDGISAIQLHETMHAIGFHHTWQDEHYSGDFSYGPMGYFAYHNGTSTFDRNWVQGTYLDQMEALLWDDFLAVQDDLGVNEKPETYQAENAALAAFASAQAFYNEMRWLETFDALQNAKDWTKRLLYSTLDTTPPVIEDWGTIPEEIDHDGFVFWAEVTDNLAGIENVTLYVQVDNDDIEIFPCSYGGSNWTVQVHSLNYNSSLRVWVVAWDWGMNKVEVSVSDIRILNMFVPLIIITSTAGIVIGLVGYTLKQRRGVKNILAINRRN